ncbi:hypothetical protein MNEG_13690, partial [Monoraphidium neglectum]
GRSGSPARATCARRAGAAASGGASNSTSSAWRSWRRGPARAAAVARVVARGSLRRRKRVVPTTWPLRRLGSA